MIVVAIDDGDVEGRARQALGGRQASETGADDNNTRMLLRGADDRHVRFLLFKSRVFTQTDHRVAPGEQRAAGGEIELRSPSHCGARGGRDRLALRESGEKGMPSS